MLTVCWWFLFAPTSGEGAAERAFDSFPHSSTTPPSSPTFPSSTPTTPPPSSSPRTLPILFHDFTPLFYISISTPISPITSSSSSPSEISFFFPLTSTFLTFTFPYFTLLHFSFTFSSSLQFCFLPKLIGVKIKN